MAQNLIIELKPIEKKLHLSIIDDGLGFDESSNDGRKTLSGNGLNNMRPRAKELKGELQIISSKGDGTKIVFTWNPKFESLTR